MNYVPIRTSTLRPKCDFTFDIYLQLSGKYVLYIKKGDDIQKERLQKLKAKKVRQMFIVDQDEPIYQQFLDQALFDVADDENLSLDEKAEASQGVAATAVEDINENYDNKDSFVAAENAAKGLVQVIRKNPDILKDLFVKTQESDSDVHVKHAINVSFLAVKFAETLKMDNATIENMCVAGMLHDIGQVKMAPADLELFTRAYSKMSKEEFIRYREHPRTGHKLLFGKDYINNQILDLILTHEETKAGTGFPEGLNKLTLEQEVFSLTCCYDRHVTLLGYSHEEAMKMIQIDQLGNYELSSINTLKKIIKEQGVLS